MSKELFEILTNSNKDIDNQKLMDYISGRLSEQDKKELEEQISENSFMQDAVEGLKELKDSKKLSIYLEQLNRELKTRLNQPKLRRKKHNLAEFPWVYLTIALILVLSIVCFLLVRQLIH
jgi:hypothetical protein